MAASDSHCAARRWSFALAVLSCAVAALSAGLPARPAAPAEQQAPAATFRAGVELVEVPVVVEREGRFVETLGQSDFEIYEDGRRQSISAFSLVEGRRETVAGKPATADTVPPDVQSNAAPSDGRLFVLVLDDLHIAAVRTGPARQLLRAFIDAEVGPRDLAAVVCTSGRTGASQDFTANRRLLTRAVDQFMGRAGDAADDAPSPPGDPLRDSPSFGGEERHNERVALAVVRDISNALAAVTGRRKALVLVSEGFDFADGARWALPSSGSGGGRSEHISYLAGAISAAVRANVSVYAVDPAGLTLAGGRADVSGWIDAGKPQSLQGVQALDATASARLLALRELSDDTGGFAVVNTNNVAGTLGRIGDDLDRYYLLGYHASPPTRDGKFHRLDVKVRVPGVDVRARAGYVASPAAVAKHGQDIGIAAAGESAVSATLDSVLRQPLPVPGLRLTVSAAPFRGRGRTSAVTIVLQLDGRDLAFSSSSGRFDGRLQLVVLATDPEGRTKNSLTRSFGLPLGKQSHELVTAQGIRVVDRIDLPPGRYRLRLGAGDVESRKTGSVHYDLEVPDFGAHPLSMSGVLLASSLAGLVPCAPSRPLDALRQVLPGPPTVARVFRPGEELRLFAEIYDRHRGARAVDVVTTVRTHEGREVLRHDDEWAATPALPDDDTYKWTGTVALHGLPAGRYVLRVEARSRAHAEDTASREIPFEIATEGDGTRAASPGRW